MEKQEALQIIKSLAEENIATENEIIGAYRSGLKESPEGSEHKKIGIAEILYYIGGAIVFLGISIFIWQNWITLNTPTKIIATLGSGIAAYIVGLLFSRDNKTETVGIAFHLIAALVTPLGLHVTFNAAGFNAGSLGMQCVISGILFAVYIASYLLLKKQIFVVFSVIFGTWLFFAFTSFLAGFNAYYNSWKFFEYRGLLVGLSYIGLGYYFSQDKKETLSSFLYGFGVVEFLAGAIALGGWKPNQNIFWELIFPGLVFGVLFLSVYLKSRTFLIFGTIYLMAYILKITAEYFSTGLGWPLALVISGFMLIAVGYMSIQIKRKYLSD